MPSGIRATVAFPADACPVAAWAASVGTTIDSVTTSLATGDATCVTEFSADRELDTSDSAVTLVFSRGSTHWYRFEHGGGGTCPCTLLGQYRCAVARFRAHDGSLIIVFYATDYEQLQTVVGALREHFPEVDIRRLVRSPTESQETDSVYVDRGRLTARQLETLETAYEMGYFERPRRANATEVAAELDIDQSTFSQHLAAAETKLIEDVLEKGV